MSGGALPTFVVIGAAKCATTSVHHYLGSHPEIQVSRRKELRFFVDQAEPHALPVGGRPVPRGEWQRGLAWYRSWFDPAFAIRGEATPAYTSVRFSGAAERMAAVIPAARLIYCVRDPVRRALSHYHQALSDWYETQKPAAALTPGSHYVQNSRYAERLAPYLRHWPLDRILILAVEDLAADPQGTLARALEFVGADPRFASSGGKTALNVSGSKSGLRWHTLQAFRRQPWWPRVAELAPRRMLPALDRLTSAPRRRAEAPGPPIDDDVADAVRAAVADDCERLRALTGRRFEGWSV